MKTPDYRYRCALGSLQPITRTAEDIKRDGWQEQRILAVSVDDDRLSDFDRMWVEKIGRKLYGEPAPKINPHR